MKEMNNSATCERAGELVSVLYGEATEREQSEFELHAKHCASCRDEFAAFAQVREAVGEWRDEALNGFVSSPVVATPVRKSAVTALRQFFGLSPLWLKGAVAFAALVFCVSIFLAFGRSQSNPQIPELAIKNPEAVYSETDLRRILQDERAKQTRQSVTTASVNPVAPAPRRELARVRATPLRRPFSRAERDQLAAELRLLTTSEENELESPDK